MILVDVVLRSLFSVNPALSTGHVRGPSEKLNRNYGPSRLIERGEMFVYRWERRDKGIVSRMKV